MPLTIELLLLTAVLGQAVMLMETPTQPATAEAHVAERCGKRPSA
jgi:hypothetical protein